MEYLLGSILTTTIHKFNLEPGFDLILELIFCPSNYTQNIIKIQNEK